MPTPSYTSSLRQNCGYPCIMFTPAKNPCCAPPFHLATPRTASHTSGRNILTWSQVQSSLQEQRILKRGYCDELCSPPFIKRHVTQDQDPHVTQKAQQSCQKPIHPCIRPTKPAAPPRDLSNPKTTYANQMRPQVPSTKARTTLHDHPQLISLHILQGPLLAFTTPLHLCAHLATHTIGVSIYDRLNLKVWCPAKACMTRSNPPYSPDQLEEEDDTFSIT
jgi:hypothetical protein